MAAPAHTRHRARPPQARETTDVTRYLHALFGREHPGAWIEVRYRYRASMRHAFFAPTAVHAAARTIVRLGISTDVYVGVAARRRRHGAKHAITTVATLWADLDTPDARRALQRLPVAPSIVVASGTDGHVHAYWPLTTAVAIADAEATNRRLAAELGGDQGAVTNAATILRPPGTYSFKHTPPAPVVLEALVERR